MGFRYFWVMLLWIKDFFGDIFFDWRLFWAMPFSIDDFFGRCLLDRRLFWTMPFSIDDFFGDTFFDRRLFWAMPFSIDDFLCDAFFDRRLFWAMPFSIDNFFRRCLFRSTTFLSDAFFDRRSRIFHTMTDTFSCDNWCLSEWGLTSDAFLSEVRGCPKMDTVPPALVLPRLVQHYFLPQLLKLAPLLKPISVRCCERFFIKIS